MDTSVYQVAVTPSVTLPVPSHIDKSAEKIQKLRKRLKVSQQKTRRLQSKVKTMKAVIDELKKKDLISSNCEQLLRENFTGIPLEIMQRKLQKKKVSYSPEIKSFALTLQFYSSKAYEFVRRSFNLVLPHQRQIRRWYSKVTAEPGFTDASFKALKRKVEEASEKDQTVLCALMIDEMAIKRNISWDGQRFRGYVDIGNGIPDDDSSPVAKDALVFMAVSVNSFWKVPIAYFLVDGMSGSERANLVNVAIKKLFDTGVRVISLTCDGPSCHFTMLSSLGANISNPSNLKTYFQHPLDRSKRVHVILDICHMLKLVRNTLGSGGIIVDKDGNKIRWKYIEELESIQSKEGLR